MKRRNRVPILNPLGEHGANFEKEILDSCVASAMRIVLMGNLSRKSVTTKLVIDEIKRKYPTHANAASLLAEFSAYKANEELMKTFGFKLFVGDPCEEPKQSDMPGKKSFKIRVTDIWVLINTINIEQYISEPERAEYGVLMAILSFLMFSKERVVAIKILEEHLSNLFENSNSSASENSSTFKETVDSLINSGYLKKVKTKGDDGELEDGVEIGVRSLVEIGEDKILNFMSKITKVKLSNSAKKDHFFLSEDNIESNSGSLSNSSSSQDDISGSQQEQSQRADDDTRNKKRQRT